MSDYNRVIKRTLKDSDGKFFTCVQKVSDRQLDMLIPYTSCKTVTHTTIEHSSHGVIRKEITTVI